MPSPRSRLLATTCDLLATATLARHYPHCTSCRYEVAIKTSKRANAGTDGNVYVTLYGEHGDSGRKKMDNCKNHKVNKFEQGATDLFDLQCVDVGRPTKVKDFPCGTVLCIVCVLFHDM